MPYNLELISSPYFHEAIREKRSLRERFFSLPFHPFQLTKITGYKPMNYGIRVGNTIFASPEFIDKAREIIRAV